MMFTDIDALWFMVQQAPIGICVLDAMTMVSELVNDKFLEVAGKPRDLILGKNYWEPFAEARLYYESALQGVAETGEPYYANEVELMLIRHGVEERIFVTFVYNPIKDNTGKVVKIAVWVLENTRQVKARQEINELNHQLAEAIRDMRAGNDTLSDLNRDLKLSNDNINLLNRRLLESETDFKRLVEQAPVAILVFRGPEMVIDLANEAMLLILDKDKGVIGKPLLEGLPEIEGAPAVDMLFEVFRTGKALDGMEAPVPIRREGKVETRYFNFSYRPLLAKGEIIGVMDVAIEVTGQVLARQRIEANEQRLQGILDTMAEGVVIVDTNGTPTYTNPMAQRIMGLTEAQFRDRTYNDNKWQNERIDGSLMPVEDHPMHVVMRTGLPVFDQEIGIVMPSKKKIYISVNAAPLTGERQEVTGAIVTFTDVTNRRLILQQKDDFISVASHELKTPVTSLKASLQLLERMQENIRPDVLARLLGQANKSLNKLNELVNSLLDSNRISQGRFPIHKTTFSIAEMINDCCQHVRAAGEHDIRFEADLGLQITADEQLLDQVIVNLVNNAVKYAPGSRDILITAKKEARVTRITVSDKGPGIPPEKAKHIFERYYQAGQDSRQFAGLGLGLYISAEIIRNHGGEIGVESMPGKGSTFWFTIPDQADGPDDDS